MVILAVTGLYAYLSLPREAAPEIPIPYVIVTTRYEGVSPSDMESLVTRPIERKLKALSKIKEMRSISSEGVSMIILEFDINEDIDTALQRVKDKVDLAKPDLPDDADDPVVDEVNIAEMPIMFVNLSGDVGLVKLKKIADDLEDKFDAIPGVLDAAVVGGLEREIHVEFDPDRLSAYGLNPSEVITVLRANNQNTPGGDLKIGEAKYSLKVPAEFNSPREITNLVLEVRNGRPIYLTDICRIVDSYKDPDSYSRVDGKSAVTIVISKRSGVNLLKIADRVKQIVRDWPLPPTVKVAVTADRSKMVRDMVADLENNIISALILVLAVILVALGGRSALFVTLAIPFSMLITMDILAALGITLNMVVLFSLILALGMLVDNAIVIVENIYRHYAMGKTRAQAAREGAAEVAWPVTASTATTVAAFVPLLFWPEIIGKFLSYLPKTVIIALVASLFVALVINPALCSRLMRRRKAAPEDLETRVARSRFMRAYRAFLAWALRNRASVIGIAFLSLFATIFAYAKLGKGVIFFPETEPNRAYIELTAPEGTRLEETDKLARKIERILDDYPEIKRYTANIGPHGGGNPFESGGGTESNRAQIVIDFVDAEYRTSPSSQVIVDIRKRLADFVGAKIKVEKEQHGPSTGPPVNIEIYGDDYGVLADLAQKVENAIKNVDGLVDLRDDFIIGRPEIKVVIDKERAALFDLTAAEIAFMVRTAMNGTKVGVYREGEDEYDIIVRLPEYMRRSIADLRRLMISDRLGHQIPLTSVADIVTTSGLGTIKRIDQKRTVTVMANTIQRRGRTNDDIRKDVKTILATMAFPAGYTYKITGEAKEQRKATAFLSKAFIVSLFLIALVLVTEFNSILRPAIIMTSVILSLVGVLWGLILTQTPFSVIMTGLGVISLAGVVVNNAIVLIDYVEILRSKGRSVHEALIEAGLTRFRPVMLTAVTTVLGLLPMAVGLSYDFHKMEWMIRSESSQWWGPMAVAVIFGLSVATILTLVIVPTLYSVTESIIELWRKIFGTGEEEEEAPTAPAPEPATIVSQTTPAPGRAE